MSKEEIRDYIIGYGLFENLEAALQLVVKGGVSRRAIYYAFEQGATSPKRKAILDTATQIIAQHEASVVEAVLAM
jgi:hypothetical protein